MTIVTNESNLDSPESLRKLKEKMLSVFKCQQSGNCCRCPGVVYATQPEISSMASVLHTSIYDFREKYIVKRNGWDVIADVSHRPNCFLNNNNKCSIYEARPKACRTYPDWPEIWTSRAQILKECASCPGLKKAFEFVLKKLC